MAREIEHLVNDEGQASYRDVAAFYRTNAQSRVLEDALCAPGSARVVGGVRFYERREVKDTLAYLRALVNPRGRGLGSPDHQHPEARPSFARE